MNAGLPKILIVDDQRSNIVAMKTVLSLVDAQVIEANSGQEALERILEHSFALILLDVNMPDMDGFEVATVIASDDDFRHIPIIFVSAAFRERAHRQRGYEAGAVDYIPKPIEEDVLISKVNIFLDLYKQKRQLELLRDDLEARVDERTAELRRTQKLARVGGWSADLSNNSYHICDNARAVFFSKTLGTEDKEISVGSLLDLLPEGERQRVTDIFKFAYANKLEEVEYEFQFFDEEDHPGTALTFATLTYKDGEPVAIHGAIQDITERKVAESKLQHVATHDALTGLPNRYLFKDRLDQAFLYSDRSDKHVAILLLDLDQFKDINDTLGHPVGDMLLTEVGNRLSEVARSSDTVARLGGDEFAIICSNMAAREDIDYIASRCIKTLNESFNIDGNDVNSGCSIGIACYPSDGDNADELIKHADLALYQSKARGRGIYHFYDLEMSETIKIRKDREDSLRNAVDREEFELYYQPKLDLATQQVVGVEALIRWNHPEDGLIPPNDFIALAESTGIIHSLGEWVIKEACRVASRWREMYGDQLKIAVNASAVQIRSEGFVDQVASCLQEANTPGHLLEIEITESVVLDDPIKTSETLDELRIMGITIALDDFGTGYSSLTHLKHLRASTLKIDRSFVRNIVDDHYDLHIAEKIIELAHKLQMEVVAEGIETPDQMNLLLERSCDVGQGYMFSRPMPERDFLNWLANYELEKFNKPHPCTDKSTTTPFDTSDSSTPSVDVALQESSRN